MASFASSDSWLFPLSRPRPSHAQNIPNGNAGNTEPNSDVGLPSNTVVPSPVNTPSAGSGDAQALVASPTPSQPAATPGQTPAPTPTPAATPRATATATPTPTPTPTPNVPPAEKFLRTQKILEAFDAIPAKTPVHEIKEIKTRPTLNQLKFWLKFFDPKGQFQRFFSVKSDLLSEFADRDSKSVEEFSVEILPPETRASLTLRTAAKPLAGLRIALDPGHMGTDFWDHETGKYVHDKKGVVLSEGLINLETCLVLKDEFTKLGAEVLITRTGLRPVSSKALKDIDLQAFARKELAERTLEEWFQKLINQPSLDATMAAAHSSSIIKRMFTEDMRSTYYINREDLWARAEMITAFHPDLTLIIHYDAPDSPGKDQALLNEATKDRTRGYVPGAYSPSDFATLSSRSKFVEQLLQPDQLEQSVKISEIIVGEISRQLNVPIEVEDGGNTVRVAPGVFSRNLELTKSISEGIISYLECLMYGSKDEFAKFNVKELSMDIEGVKTPYSTRVRDVAFAIRDGVVKFYQSPNIVSQPEAAPTPQPTP